MNTDQPSSTPPPSSSTSIANNNLNLIVPTPVLLGDMTMHPTTPSVTVTSPTYGTTTTIIEAPNSSSNSNDHDRETTQVSNAPATIPKLHQTPSTSSVPVPSPSPPPQPAQERDQDIQDPSTPSLALSPSPTISPASDPQVGLTFLHLSGRRRTLAFPADTTVARVKEVVWNTWPKEWYDGTGVVQGEVGTRDNLKDELPAAPGFIRLFNMGKMWTDESRLSDMGLSPYQPTIVHVAVRPSDVRPTDDSLAKKARRRVSRTASSGAAGGEGANDRGGVGGGGCCGCIIC